MAQRKILLDTCSEIELVTDDADLIEVAEEFAVPVMRTLQLLRFMVDVGHIELENARQCIDYDEFGQTFSGASRAQGCFCSCYANL